MDSWAGPRTQSEPPTTSSLAGGSTPEPLLVLLGAVGCYGAMFLVHAPATVMAILISYGIFILLKRRSIQRNWGNNFGPLDSRIQSRN
jgi:hypothetical protein